MTRLSRYRSEAEPDYSHRFHAGNVGDVWKHCVAVEVLGRVAATGRRVEYVETHAGEGQYALGATGEWTEGIGRLWSVVTGGDDAVARYVALSRRLGGTGIYPGSPAFARAVLGPEAGLTLWERDETAAGRLAAHVAADPRTRIYRGDGLAALSEAVRDATSRAEHVVVLVDPPWLRKADWVEVPDALAAAVRAAPRAAFLLWYPVKSLTRPNAMIARLRAAGVVGAIAELITTPLERQHHRLNGSAVLLVRPPAGTLEAVAAVAPIVGAHCATGPGTWSFRAQAWGVETASQSAPRRRNVGMS